MEVDTMSLRREFIMLAMDPDSNTRELCRRFQISPKTGYKWFSRFRQAGEAGLKDRSRRPKRSPARTPSFMEDEVLRLRKKHRAWGGRKLRAQLIKQGYTHVPAASTITEILRRHNRLDPEESAKHEPFNRFEQPAPNLLWQMDFKGHFAMRKGRCHPLTILDDHSRYSLGLFACENERRGTVQDRLSHVFRRFGLPDRMLMDNGSPWGSDRGHPHTRLTVWLMHLGVGVTHCRPYHPQTQGKDERFHKTLKAEVLRYETFKDLAQCQRRFDQWRHIYNYERPHESLDMGVPASRYRASGRPFPDNPPAIEYGPSDEVRKVQQKGLITYKGRKFRLCKAFVGYPLALRPTGKDGILDVYFCNHKIDQINLKDENPQ